ncbi:MAG TPA: hypothetical protein VGH15_05635 [Caulobacteraceae bacterium]|jgi:hypothetical protein
MSAEVIPLRRHGLTEGDVVRLKGVAGANPLMLVGVADGETVREVTCIWMGGARNRRLQSAIFPCDRLELVLRGSQP